MVGPGFEPGLSALINYFSIREGDEVKGEDSRLLSIYFMPGMLCLPPHTMLRKT